MGDQVEVTPQDLKFRFQLNKQLLGNISISNPMSSRVAFKIKTTAPKKYVVRPSSGIVDAKSSMSIQVIMQAQKDYPADFQNCKDKFMVQTTVMAADEDQLTPDTFNKEVRKDLKETRLRVVLEGPAAPPSPVPEANENDDEGARAEQTDTRLKTTLSDLSNVTAENKGLKDTVDKLTKERDELRRLLDQIQLQQSNKPAAAQAAQAQDPALKFRVSMIHIILVAIIGFLIGHFT